MAAVSGQAGREGQRIQSAEDVEDWISRAEPRDRSEPFTFVVDPHGILRLAPRRSEHVACAGGGEVLAAGEITFARCSTGWRVDQISNQSTGYCPDPSSFGAVAAALDRIGIERPDCLDGEFIFRRCPDCYYVSVVREQDFVCALCDHALPEVWNVDPHE